MSKRVKEAEESVTKKVVEARKECIEQVIRGLERSLKETM
jgi:hypothetical protein